MKLSYRKESYVWYLPFQIQCFIMETILRKDMFWSDDGKLFERTLKGHGVEVSTWFSGWMFVAYAKYIHSFKIRMKSVRLKLTGRIK